MTTLRIGGLLLLVKLLAACTTTAAQHEPVDAMASVTGSVSYLQRIALPPEAWIQVRLVDVSRADAPAVVLGEQRIRSADRQPPFSFAIDYDPDEIRPGHSYAVQARIEADGRLLFISDRHYAVITRGAPAHVDLILKQVSAR